MRFDTVMTFIFISTVMYVFAHYVNLDFMRKRLEANKRKGVQTGMIDFWFWRLWYYGSFIPGVNVVMNWGLIIYFTMVFIPISLSTSSNYFIKNHPR